MDDTQNKTQQPISDDQELAKVLAGVNQQADNAASGMQFEETQNPTTPPAPVNDGVNASPNQEAASSFSELPSPPPAPTPAMPAAPGVGSDLENIKKDALNELRPLVDKLDVSPEEKFDTYLLLIRSTDDQSLVGPAHDAAKLITDEARKAQALLDVIKEIDYLSQPQQPAA